MSKSKSKDVPALRQQSIDESGPGTILHDFEQLLEFVGPEGVRATGKYHMLPIDRLAELDERMARPLHPRLARPQQRSFPHIHGLYLLLRATWLGVPEGLGKKTGRLVLDAAMLEQWRALNPTERYFNLLEAWLRHGRPEMIGERGGGLYNALIGEVGQLWRYISALESRSRKHVAEGSKWLYGVVSFTTLALFELFGLADVRRGEAADGENWRILEVRQTEFGKALMEIVRELMFADLGKREDRRQFGAWQPTFQKHFPEWRNNLVLPEPEFREGVYYFKVKLGSPWRRIAIAADGNLDQLAGAIIRAFKFDGDHLYDFEFTDRSGSKVTVAHPHMEEAERFTDEYPIGELPLPVGQSMTFTYDYGAHWEFDVKLEKIGPPKPRMKQPRVVASHGKPPPEYEEFDEDEW